MLLCHLVFEIRGDLLVVKIPPCVKCKRPMIRDTFKAVSNDDQYSLTVAPATAATKILFACKKCPVKFQVGTNDLAKMVTWPSNKIEFESDDRYTNTYPQLKTSFSDSEFTADFK
jgi:deoxycytidylate deaminase